MKQPSFVFLCVLVALQLAGCVSYAPSGDLIGQSRDALIAKMGKPEREYAADGLQKLHYPRGPRGSHTYFVYLDDFDRVVKWEQVLSESRFTLITPGLSKDQVIDAIGVTSIIHGLARDRGYVWHYRYHNEQCKSFVIEFTAEDVVRTAGYRIRSGRRCKFVGQGA